MKKETTIITLANMTAEQKAMLSEEQVAAIEAITSTVSEKQVSNLLTSMLKEAEKAKKLEAEKAAREQEKANKEAARQAKRDAEHAEKYLSFHSSYSDPEADLDAAERSDLKGMVVVTSKEYGKEVVIPSGHDSNAVVIVRQLATPTSYRTLLTSLHLTEKRDGMKHEDLDVKVDYEVVFETKQKRCARTANLVHNNRVLVSGWIIEAIDRFRTIDGLIEFLQKQVNSKGESRYNTLNLDLLTAAGTAGDKTSARLAKKYSNYFTLKSIR